MTPSSLVRTLRGIVVSDKMQKTIVVRVDRTVMHPKYHKRYVQSRRLKAHDEQGEAKMGDQVEIVASRPRSAEKRFALRRVVARASESV